MIKRVGLPALLSLALAGCSMEEQPVFEPGEERPGGDTSVTIAGRNSFSMPAGNMKVTRRLDFNVGNSFFRNPWVASPSSTTARDGLGPLFNTNSCQNCHIKDGRGHAPKNNDLNKVSLLMRISIPATADTDPEILIKDGSVPHPVYGGQIQDFALPGSVPEGRVQVRYEYSQVTLKGGETVELRKPFFSITDPGYGPLPDDLMMSARVASPMIGLGLLEALTDSSLLTYEDPEDRDGDGISGRANRVWDHEQGRTVMGRFGWKAGQPNLKQQNAAAFNGDMGITSSLFAEENCSESQKSCRDLLTGEKVEISDKILKKVTFYTRNLAVPVRSEARNKTVLKGKKLFSDIGCAGCHIPSYKTPRLRDQPEQSDQLIWPYTDLLLHDMGEELADHRPEFLASGVEWRTPPLWGIGKTHEVSIEATFLHDGRARTIQEAILWHGGEAQASRDRFVSMEKTQRAALLKFIGSL
ncbi:di-heme oxidoredictase family protein [Endozoicomonas arenosclerae]|uniref:di-heme oxidoreductase family protein n=1 Tax=Endozoicomonas arenosclerae TaxID=1633495 RepID=UPI000783A756|nr:di-heme oxidoredictase family protein [Endozoicomonas arenosclerae]